jgi:enamine deaminase RidA (YjgF/YER057c/UK114 family)
MDHEPVGREHLAACPANSEERAMTVTVHNPDGLAAPLGLYSHVAEASGSRTVVVAGQVGLNHEGALVGDADIVAQTLQTYENVGLALASARATWSDVVKLATFVVSEDLIDGFFSAREQAFAELFPDGKYPPNTLLIVRRLVRPELLVEIEATAVTNG